MRSACKVLFILSLVAFCMSCGITRRIPSGEHLLSKVDIKIDMPKQDSVKLPKNTELTVSELSRYIRQEPNNRILGMNLSLWIYARANPDKSNWWNRLKRRIGEPPVLLDTALIASSAEAMKIYMDSRGYLRSDISYQIDTVKRRASVKFISEPKEPYKIENLSYNFKDKFLRPVILKDTASTLVHTGNLFDVNVLYKERARITNYLKNNGYYNFSVNNITFSADTTLGDNKVNLTMIVGQYLIGYDQNDETLSENNHVYRIRDIYIHPEYNATAAATDSLYNSRLDTIEYKGLYFVYDKTLGVRPEILSRAINISPNLVYNASLVKRTYNSLMLLGYYKSASILFSDTPVDSLSTDNMVTYVGADAEGMAESTQESYLDCNIFCTPSPKQSITTELEGTTSSDYFGVMAKIGYQNRNIFKGVESFDISFRGGYEFMRVKSKRSSFELGGATSFSFPRLITPVRVNRYNKLYNPRTKIEFSYSVQRRPYYQRTISSGTWGYSWGNGRNTNYILRPIDISIVKLSSIDSAFLQSIQNPYLRNSYTNQLIAGLSASYIFNNQLKNIESSSTSLRVNFEINGNLVNALTHLIDKRKNDKGYNSLFGIRYAQYFRVDANFARKIALGEKSSIVYRLYGGWGYAYGNASTIPFDRMFYAGGSNSMRGWLARTLGPGNDPLPKDDTFPRQLGNFKLETNLEGRFPVWGVLHGALFFDVGNIWFIRQGNFSSGDEFKLNRFYKQLGFNTGLGARFDFNLFVFRIDWGIKLHNPNNPAGERWINSFQMKNTTLNFGVGYPF